MCHGSADPANRAANPEKRGGPAAEDRRALWQGGRASVAEPPGAGECGEEGVGREGSVAGCLWHS